MNELNENYSYRFTLNEDTLERLMHALKGDGVKDFQDNIRDVLDVSRVPVEVFVANLRRKFNKSPSKIIFTKKRGKEAK